MEVTCYIVRGRLVAHYESVRMLSVQVAVSRDICDFVGSQNIVKFPSPMLRL